MAGNTQSATITSIMPLAIKDSRPTHLQRMSATAKVIVPVVKPKTHAPLATDSQTSSIVRTPQQPRTLCINNAALPVPQLSTSKVWVLPPRPKPGRKPSTDTPTTKRKAQNRAAQRVFRERRAARVSELEEMLGEVTKEKDEKEDKLRRSLKSLEEENAELRRSLDELKNEIMAVKRRASHDRWDSRRNGKESFLYQSNPSAQTMIDPNLKGAYPSSMSHMTSPALSAESPMDLLDRALELRLPVAAKSEPKKITISHKGSDCGVCVKDDCICESLGLRSSKGQSSSSSPRTGPQFHIPDYTASPVPLKRRRRTSVKANPFKKLPDPSDSSEIDFTEVFAKVSQTDGLPPRKRRMSSRMVPVGSMGNSDRCGVCAPGTPCTCAGNKTLSPLTVSGGARYPSFSRNLPQESSPNTAHRNRLPSISSHDYQPLASPISVVPVDQLFLGPSGDRSKSASEGGCTGNPGNCSQCRADPMSTLFCTTLASRVYASTTVKSSRHSITGPGERRNTDKMQSNQPTTAAVLRDETEPATSTATAAEAAASKKLQLEALIQLPPGTPSTATPSGTFIPCSAAYQTLSRHKDFRRVDLANLVGKLNTRGMQVEVGSVANVLRELDRRFSTSE